MITTLTLAFSHDRVHLNGQNHQILYTNEKPAVAKCAPKRFDENKPFTLKLALSSAQLDEYSTFEENLRQAVKEKDASLAFYSPLSEQGLLTVKITDKTIIKKLSGSSKLVASPEVIKGGNLLAMDVVFSAWQMTMEKKINELAIQATPTVGIAINAVGILIMEGEGNPQKEQVSSLMF